ncbi:MAG: hypothetical protein ACK4RT_04595 [Erythrobacter sp.]
MKARFLGVFGAVSALTLTAPIVAQDTPKVKAAKSAPAAAPAAQVRSRDLVGTFGGQRIAYRATIADTILTSEDGKAEAVIVTTSYVKIAAINQWMRETLGYKSDRTYQSIGNVGSQWDWSLGSGRGRQAYLNIAPLIGQAMRQNSGLRLFNAQGYYDFATPFFGAEYSLKRTGIPQERITWKYYHAGHMMYVRDEDQARLSADLREFIRAR